LIELSLLGLRHGGSEFKVIAEAVADCELAQPPYPLGELMETGEAKFGNVAGSNLELSGTDDRSGHGGHQSCK
jgi:hypothetical protein